MFMQTNKHPPPPPRKKKPAKNKPKEPPASQTDTPLKQRTQTNNYFNQHTVKKLLPILQSTTKTVVDMLCPHSWLSNFLVLRHRAVCAANTSLFHPLTVSCFSKIVYQLYQKKKNCHMNLNNSCSWHLEHYSRSRRLIGQSVPSNLPHHHPTPRFHFLFKTS